ncbi:MAG: threonine synthase [Candidatus Anammoxibacter sp.]
MGYVKGLKCRECGRDYPKEPIHVCSFCFGPLEVSYDYDAIKSCLTREIIKSREPNMWRYHELLPIDGDPVVGHHVGFTPLVKANNLGKVLGIDNLYIKNDSVNHPTFSFKDRVVAVALSKAREFGFDTVACATTGNLGNSVAAHAVQGNFKSYIFLPANIEQSKIIGTSVYGINVIGVNSNYDGVNRLCAEIADKYGWAIVNVNLRPYYAEGSKTYGYEIVEQLGWKAPRHVIVPMAGGSLILKIRKAINEMHKLGFIDRSDTCFYGAQATGCAPITSAVKENLDVIRPVKPNTIAHSIAIGNPADGHYSKEAIKESGGWGEDVTDEELVEGIKLLAETEGIFTETAGGVTVAATQKLIKQGKLPTDETVVICITGNGLKTQDAIIGKLKELTIIEPDIKEVDKIVEKQKREAAMV